AEHETLQRFRFDAGLLNGSAPEFLFTDNETNLHRVFGAENLSRYMKDAFHEYVIDDKKDAVSPRGYGTKVAAYYRATVPAGGQISLSFRLSDDSAAPPVPFGEEFEQTFALRQH